MRKYVKTEWIPEVTLVSSENLNKIEQQLEDLTNHALESESNGGGAVNWEDIIDAPAIQVAEGENSWVSGDENMVFTGSSVAFGNNNVVGAVGEQFDGFFIDYDNKTFKSYYDTNNYSELIGKKIKTNIGLITITNIDESAFPRTYYVDKMPQELSPHNWYLLDFSEKHDLYATAKGSYNFVYGLGAAVEGHECIARGEHSHAEGQKTETVSSYSHAEGYSTTASGDVSHAEGYYSYASGLASHAEGWDSYAGGTYSHSEGQGSKALGFCSHAEGLYCRAEGYNAHAEGKYTKAIGQYSHTEGEECKAEKDGSHAEGYYTRTIEKYSHAEGYKSYTEGQYSHAEGFNTYTEGLASHAEGEYCFGKGRSSHAEGYATIAEGLYSHAEGGWTTSKGKNSHAEGYSTIAQGDYSHAEGHCTCSFEKYQHVSGKYNIDETITKYSDLSIIGNGYSTRDNKGNSITLKNNAFAINTDGTAYAFNAFTSPNTGYGEMYEWADGNEQAENRIGYFVAFDSDTGMIRKANSSDEYVLGIVKNNLFAIGQSYNAFWQGKFKKDEFSNIEVKSSKEYIPLLSDEFDKEQKYMPRNLRQEWTSVCMFGKTYVRVDETIVAGGFCKPNDEGIATKSDTGYYVIRKVTDDVAEIIFK